MTEGLPFWGTTTSADTPIILNKEINKELVYNTMNEFIEEGVYNKNLLVIIDDKWLTWLKDIKFNYRDHMVMLPYWSYETIEHKRPAPGTVAKGHLLLTDDPKTYLLRYNFKLNYMHINLDSKLVVYDLETGIKASVTITNWYEDVFDLENLYNKYVFSSFEEDDELLTGHEPGYTFIYRQFKGFNNVESKHRKELELKTFEAKIDDRDFRDVRKYRKAELFSDIIVPTLPSYKLRRLRFDNLLYCIIAQGAVSNDKKFNERFEKLKSQSCILSYRYYNDTPPLIFKSYWFGVGSYEDKRAILTKV